MKSWLQSITRKDLMTMLMTMGIIGVAAAAHAAGGGGAIGAWGPMGTIAESASGTPAFACGSMMMVGSGIRICMGEIGTGMYSAACGVGGTWLAANAGPALTQFGIAGALS